MNFETITVILSVGFFVFYLDVSYKYFILYIIFQKAVAFVSQLVRNYLQKKMKGVFWFFFPSHV